jgi:hypothetical protein
MIDTQPDERAPHLLTVFRNGPKTQPDKMRAGGAGDWTAGQVRTRKYPGPELTKLLRFARDGDTLVAHSMDRLSRNLDDLRALVQGLTREGVRVEFVKENLVFTGASPCQLVRFRLVVAQHRLGGGVLLHNLGFQRGCG